MSVNLIVIPTRLNIATWGEIKARLQKMLTPSEVALTGKQIVLLTLNSNQRITEDTSLSLGKHYYLMLMVRNSPGIAVVSKRDDPDPENLELDMLEDYGHNLTPTDIQMIANRWQKVDYYYNLTSSLWQDSSEQRLFISLATAIAYTCAGFIIVTDNKVSNLGVGVYTPEQLWQARNS